MKNSKVWLTNFSMVDDVTHLITTDEPEKIDIIELLKINLQEKGIKYDRLDLVGTDMIEKDHIEYTFKYDNKQYIYVDVILMNVTSIRK